MKEKHVIPEHWLWVVHEDISVINPKLTACNLSDDTEVSFLPMTCVEEVSGKYNLQLTRKYKEVKKGYTSFIDGDVIFAKITPCMENGKVAVVDNLLNGVGFGSTEFHVSRPVNGVDNKYLFFYFIQSSFRKEARKNMTGSAGQLRVPSNYFKQVSLPLPPLPEQRAIVAKIEQLFSELDNGIANLKKALEQLKVYRQAALKKAFEGELTREWREQQTVLPSAKELLDRITEERETAAKAEGKKLKPVKPITEKEESELPVLPKGWMWLKTSQIIDPINNGYTPNASNLTSGKGDIPFLKVYNLCFDGKLNFSKDPTFIPNSVHQKQLSRSIVYPSDILINIVGPPLGKVSIVSDEYPQWNINQAIVFFRPNQYLLSEFISYCMQNLSTIRWLENTSKATAGQFNIKVSTCRELPFPFCSPIEQTKIEEEIETRFSVCENVESSIKESLEKAEALRQSILKKAFEGSLLTEAELEETRRAPDWEPAEKLLERIRAEKMKIARKQ
jgi:type I restriction enzyme S subunit